MRKNFLLISLALLIFFKREVYEHTKSTNIKRTTKPDLNVIQYIIKQNTEKLYEKIFFSKNISTSIFTWQENEDWKLNWLTTYLYNIIRFMSTYKYTTPNIFA